MPSRYRLFVVGLNRGLRVWGAIAAEWRRHASGEVVHDGCPRRCTCAGGASRGESGGAVAPRRGRSRRRRQPGGVRAAVASPERLQGFSSHREKGALILQRHDLLRSSPARLHFHLQRNPVESREESTERTGDRHVGQSSRPVARMHTVSLRAVPRRSLPRRP
eukprot:743276-Alexandrium_andersonii.AAC.2